MNTKTLPQFNHTSTGIPKDYHNNGFSIDATLALPKTYDVKKIGKILQDWRNSRAMTQQEVAEALEVDQETISRIERSDSLPKRGSTARRMAELYGHSLDELQNPAPTSFTIPRISQTAGGEFREAEVDLMSEEGVPGHLYPYPARNPMVLRVVGNSMDWDCAESIADGDDVIFADSFEEEITDGELVVAMRKSDDSTTVKRVRFVDKEHIDLVPHNPRHKPIRIRRADVILRPVQVVVNYRYKRRAP